MNPDSLKNPYSFQALLMTAMLDPLGNARLIQRALNLARTTRIHLDRLPKDADRTLLNERAQIWSQLLLRVMGIDMMLTEHGQGPSDDPVLFVSNHRSYIDILLMLAARPCCFLAKADVAQWPIIGPAARRVGTVFVERQQVSSRKASRQAIGDMLEAGHNVVIFPEGTTHPAPGCQDFRQGAFEVAHALGVGVLPAAIEYARQMDAWEEESVGAHFVQCFRQPAVRTRVDIGPVLHASTPRELCGLANGWIDGMLRGHSWPLE